MESTDINPKLKELIPLYGAYNYIGRTTWFGEKHPIKDHIKAGVITLAQVAYNSVIGIEILNVLEGKPSFTSKLLEKLLQ